MSAISIQTELRPIHFDFLQGNSEQYCWVWVGTQVPGSLPTMLVFVVFVSALLLLLPRHPLPLVALLEVFLPLRIGRSLGNCPMDNTFNSMEYIPTLSSRPFLEKFFTQSTPSCPYTLVLNSMAWERQAIQVLFTYPAASISVIVEGSQTPRESRVTCLPSKSHEDWDMKQATLLPGKNK